MRNDTMAELRDIARKLDEMTSPHPWQVRDVLADLVRALILDDESIRRGRPDEPEAED